MLWLYHLVRWWFEVEPSNQKSVRSKQFNERFPQKLSTHRGGYFEMIRTTQKHFYFTKHDIISIAQIKGNHNFDLLQIFSTTQFSYCKSIRTHPFIGNIKHKLKHFDLCWYLVPFAKLQCKKLKREIKQMKQWNQIVCSKELEYCHTEIQHWTKSSLDSSLLNERITQSPFFHE